LGVTSAISSVYFGRLGDRTGHRTILLWCLLGSGLVYLPMAISQHPWHLIALQAVFGVFAGGTIPAANALIANVTDPQRRGMIFGLMASAAAGRWPGPDWRPASASEPRSSSADWCCWRRSSWCSGPSAGDAGLRNQSW
jgi:DHA1 family multidrug resistance protein-like MFS transporter